MSRVHRIRLHGPWEYEPLSRTVHGMDGQIEETEQGLPSPGHIQIPASWRATVGSEFSGRVRYLRRFNRPTGLNTSDKIWLVLDIFGLSGQVVLNDQVLGLTETADMSMRFDIMQCLRQHNELFMDLTCCLPPTKGSRLPYHHPDKLAARIDQVVLEIDAETVSPPL